MSVKLAEGAATRIDKAKTTSLGHPMCVRALKGQRWGLFSSTISLQVAVQPGNPISRVQISNI